MDKKAVVEHFAAMAFNPKWVPDWVNYLLGRYKKEESEKGLLVGFSSRVEGPCLMFRVEGAHRPVAILYPNYTPDHRGEIMWDFELTLRLLDMPSGCGTAMTEASAVQLQKVGKGS